MGKIIKKVRKFFTFFIFFFLLFNFKVSWVSGNSMAPTLRNNSWIIVDKYLFKLFDIKKGDILIVKIKDEEMIKRLEGLPGQEIYINEENIKLESNEIYVLGDNPEESIDSRNYGPIKTEKIVGKLFLAF